MSIPVPMRGFGGGGGAALNFDVKAYATEEALLADTPKENTIGIITTTDISGWAMGDYPDPHWEMSEGFLYINIKASSYNSSDLDFGLLKKGNEICIAPISAKQYVNGAWVDVTAMSYRGGEWVEWIPLGALYWFGDECTDLTGGWMSGKVSDDAPATCTKGDTYIHIEHSASSVYSSNALRTTNKIDISNAKTLYCNFTDVNNVGKSLYLGIGAATNNPTAKVDVSAAGLVSLDVSSFYGDYIVYIYSYSNSKNHSYTIDRMWYE